MRKLLEKSRHNDGSRKAKQKQKNDSSISVWTLAGIFLLLITLASFELSFVLPFHQMMEIATAEEQTVMPPSGVDEENGCNSYTHALAPATTAATTIKAPPRNCDSVYEPSKVEDYVLKNSQELGFEGTTKQGMISGCAVLWKNRNFELSDELHKFKEELEKYNELFSALVEKKQNEENKVSLVDALREQEQQKKQNQAAQQQRNLRTGSETTKVNDICQSLELNPSRNDTTTATGLVPSVFSSRDLLSYSTSGGWMEPLMPPMRHPDFCTKGRPYMIRLSYLVHDFAAFCRKLTPTSRVVLFDLGAALDFHGKVTKSKASSTLEDLQRMPAIYLSEVYEALGFHFDHIYAFEIVKKEPLDVFEAIPDNLKAAYHWYNVGISKDVGAPDNPWTLMKKNFREDDFIIVKLDIDTAFIENPLARQILEDEALIDLIDVFYFEHHVWNKDMALDWGKDGMEGSIGESMRLFRAMREKGIASHFWV